MPREWRVKPAPRITIETLDRIIEHGRSLDISSGLFWTSIQSSHHDETGIPLTRTRNHSSYFKIINWRGSHHFIVPLRKHPLVQVHEDGILGLELTIEQALHVPVRTCNTITFLVNQAVTINCNAVKWKLHLRKQGQFLKSLPTSHSPERWKDNGFVKTRS